MKHLLPYCYLLVTLIGAKVHAQDIHHDHSLHHSFLENKGQWNENVLFKTNVHGGNLWVEQGRVLFHLQDFSNLHDAHMNPSKNSGKETFEFKQTLIQLNFPNSNHINKIEKQGKNPVYYNFFQGKDESKWASNVHGYDEFTLRNIYDGIDLKFIEKEHDLKYEFIVAPGIDPNQIILNYEGHEGMKINNTGDLVIHTKLGNIIEEKPYVYQIVNGKIVDIPCSYKINDNNVTFELGQYNEFVNLIIDPTLVFATYNGAVSDNFGMTATYGYDGSAYVAGTVFGNNYPVPDPNAYDTQSNMTVPNVGVTTTDAFISKYSPDGTTMIWSTFFGGGNNSQGTDVPHSLICDIDDNIYAYGTTSSTDFPIVGGFQTAHAGGTPITFNSIGANFSNVGTDIYVTKFSANGNNLLGSTYIGGSSNDGINYKVTSGDYGGAAAYDSLTMNYGDQLRGEIMLDENNNIIVATSTRSSDFPTVNPFQPTIGGQQDGAVFKIQNDFSALMWSSYFGGTENDGAYSVKIDQADNIVFAGGTSSTDLPLPGGGFEESYQGGKADGFVVKIDPNGQNILNATHLGTNSYDQVYFVEVDKDGAIFVVGQTMSNNFPVVGTVYENPNSRQFITKFSSDLSTVDLSTVFGSSENTIDISPSAFLVDICGNIYVSGWGRNILLNTPIQNMPVTPDAYQSTSANGFDFYLIVFERDMADLLYGSYLGGDSSQEHVDGGTSRFDKNGVVYQGVCAGCGGNSDFPTSPGAWSSQNLASNCNALVFKFDFDLIPIAEFTASSTEGCAPFEVTFDNFSSDSSDYVWDFGDGNLDSTTFEPTITYTEPGTYDVYLYVFDPICDITDSAEITITVFPELVLEEMDPILQCEPTNITLTANSNGTSDNFEWSDSPDFTNILNPDPSDSVVTVFAEESGYYYIRISNDECELIDSVEVVFTSAGLELEGDQLICLQDTARFSAQSSVEGITFTNFTWSPSGIIIDGQGTNEVVTVPNGTQFVVVTAEADNGCIVTDSILVTVNEIDQSTVSATASDSLVTEGDIVILSAEPDGYTYEWFPQDGLTNPNGQETEATITESTTFTVFISDSVCTTFAQVPVLLVTFNCEEPFVYIPNAFTPNGDFNNDILFAQSTIVDDTEEFVFRIYNRWGEKVFETTEITEGWDGTWRGELCDPDVYDYYLEGFCIDGQSFLIQGNVTLIR